MANHKQHLTFSTVSGLIFGGLAWYPGGFPAVNCLLAGGLCSVGGMLPDIDIKTSRSFQDCMSITACITSMLVIIHASAMEGVSAEMISIIGAVVFLAVKFGVGGILQAFTVHRGLIHSIPFAILCGEIVFLLTTGDIPSRVLKASGLTLGFFSHLLLDEIYSVKVTEGKLRTKKSFGTALKLGQLKNMPLTIVLYFLLIGTTYISFNRPDMVGNTLDGALDQVAGWTIRGVQHFENLSQNAQQHLRENTNFRSTIPGDPAQENPEQPEALLAMANDYEREKPSRYTARRENRRRSPDTDRPSGVATPSSLFAQSGASPYGASMPGVSPSDVLQPPLLSEMMHREPQQYGTGNDTSQNTSTSYNTAASNNAATSNPFDMPRPPLLSELRGTAQTGNGFSTNSQAPTSYPDRTTSYSGMPSLQTSRSNAAFVLPPASPIQ